MYQSLNIHYQKNPIKSIDGVFDLLLLEQTSFSSLDMFHKVFCQLISYILHPDTSYSNIILLSYDLPKTVKIATLTQCTVATHRVMNFWCHTKLIVTWWGTTFGKTPWPYLVTQRLGIGGRFRKSGTTGAGSYIKFSHIVTFWDFSYTSPLVKKEFLKKLNFSSCYTVYR